MEERARTAATAAPTAEERARTEAEAARAAEAERRRAEKAEEAKRESEAVKAVEALQETVKRRLARKGISLPPLWVPARENREAVRDGPRVQVREELPAAR